MDTILYALSTQIIILLLCTKINKETNYMVGMLHGTYLEQHFVFEPTARRLITCILHFAPTATAGLSGTRVVCVKKKKITRKKFKHNFK